MGFTEIISMIGVGLAAGFIGGLLGVGGGVLMVPAFLYLLHDRIPDMKIAVGTSMAVIIATSIAATIKHHTGGRVNWQVVPWVAAAAIIGAYLGAWVTGGTKPLMLRRLFAILLMVVALKMFFSNPDSKPAAAEGTTTVDGATETAVASSMDQAKPPSDAGSGT